MVSIVVLIDLYDILPMIDGFAEDNLMKRNLRLRKFVIADEYVFLIHISILLIWIGLNPNP